MDGALLESHGMVPAQHGTEPRGECLRFPLPQIPPVAWSALSSCRRRRRRRCCCYCCCCSRCSSVCACSRSRRRISLARPLSRPYVLFLVDSEPGGPFCCRTLSRSPETDCTVAALSCSHVVSAHSLCADRLPTANRVPIMFRMHRAPLTDVLQRATPSTALPCRRLSRRTTGSAYRDKQHHHPSFGPRLSARGWRRYLACLTPPDA